MKPSVVIQRNLVDNIESLVLARHKMLFLSGPRQCGKTTLVKSLLFNKAHYFNWDDVSFKKRWTKDIDSLAEQVLQDVRPRIVLDEIHKNPKWKNQVKAFYDKYGDKIEIILTGSAHLNVYRRGADSLLGRFIHFHLHPLSYGELSSKSCMSFSEFNDFVGGFSKNQSVYSKSSASENNKVKLLFEFGGFPEPYLAHDKKVHQIWIKNRFELLIRQDIAEVSHFLRSHQIDVLASLLSGKVGSPLSVQSLREDLDVAHTTVSRWMEALKLVYFHFDISPFSKNIVRSLKKDKKIYLYDWSVIETHGARFENMVASHLKKFVDYQNDSGQADLLLSYLRDKEKNEVDFVLVQKNKPILSIEVKVSELNLDMTFLKFRKKDHYPHVQIVMTPGIYRKYKEHNAVVMSFEYFFKRLA